MARWMKHYHLVMTVLWVLMVPVSFLTGLANSVPYVTFLSLWALVATEAGAYQAGRTEVASEES